MTTPKITYQEFDEGIEMFLKILNAQPDLIKLSPNVNNEGEFLADMAVAFSLRYKALKAENGLT